MQLTEKRFHADRGKTAETYQSMSIIREVDNCGRNYLKIEIDNCQRWRTGKEYADYLRWCASQLEELCKKEGIE